jgi:hypothetical protein
MPPQDVNEMREALAALVQQIDVGDYRDSKGHPARNNVAFLHAQGMADRFGVTHTQICEALDRWGDHIASAARHLGSLRGESGAGGTLTRVEQGPVSGGA